MDYRNISLAKSEQCPCGSGKKYRACCMMRKDTWDENTATAYINNPKRMEYELLNMLEMSKASLCLHPLKEECKGKIKNAHTIQNSRILDQLVVDGHVYAIKIQIDDPLEGPTSKLKKTSRNKVTTFTGFCDYHDSNVFSSIETIEYTKTDEQNFLFAYRVFSQEYWKILMKKKSIQTAFYNFLKKYRQGFLQGESHVFVPPPIF